MDRDLALNLVRVTEAAALNAAKYMGRGDKNAADRAAVDAMRRVFDTIHINGVVVIGEGEMDEAPMLYIGENIGCRAKDDVKVDIAVDPLDGTSLIAKGRPNAISVVAIAPEGRLLHAPDMYMDKLAISSKAKGAVDLDAPLEENLRNAAKALNKDISDLTVTMLDRPRHKEKIEEIRQLGARIKLFSDGDVAGAIATAFDHTGVDMLLGIGGAPEGVIAAVAMKCMGADFQGRLMPYTDDERERCRGMGIDDIGKVLYLDDLVKGNEAYFAATGVSDGELLKGVVYYGSGKAKTHSVIMRSETGTLRFVEAIHYLAKKPQYAI